MAKTFKEVQTAMMERSAPHVIHYGQFRSIEKAATIEELLLLVKENINWCRRYNVLDVEFLERNFAPELLLQNNIYGRGSSKIVSETGGTFLFFGDASATLNLKGNSTANIIAMDNSTICIYAWHEGVLSVFLSDNSKCTTYLHTKSDLSIYCADSSDLKLTTFDESVANVRMNGGNATPITAFGRSKIRLHAYNDATSTVILCQKSTGEVKSFGNAKVEIDAIDDDARIISNVHHSI